MIHEKMRVRIAPSPSSSDPSILSDIHIGNLRTALFNWVVARQNKGTFILRMEDSDTKRSTRANADNIAKTFNAIGLVPDEGYGCKNQEYGPYLQSEKLKRYQDAAQQLIDTGHAYRCYCTSEELDKRREESIAKNPKQPFKYDGKCRDLKVHDKSKPHVIRFKAPTEGSTSIVDKVFGKLNFSHKENYDFILTRSDGGVLYNMGCVLDDIDQKITLVIRGRDHLVNLIPQILLYNAFGKEIPQLAHLGLVNNQQRQKLSKRDGSTSVGQFIAKGYTPNAILNYLARLGWGNSDAEIFSLDYMIENFKLENCGKNDGAFDPVKFASINHSHLKSEILTPDDAYIHHLKPILEAKGIDNIDNEQLKPYVNVVRSRAKNLVEAAELLAPILANEFSTDGNLFKETFDADNTKLLKRTSEFLHTVDNWTENSLRTSMKNWFDQEKLTLKQIGAPLRVALVGQSTSPELFLVLGAMGKNKSLGRIDKTLTSLST